MNKSLSTFIKKSMIVMMVLSFALLFTIVAQKDVSASAKKLYKAYYSHEADDSYHPFVEISKTKLIGNKLTMWGGIYKVSKSGEDKELKFKERTYKLSSKVKYYELEGSPKAHTISKKLGRKKLKTGWIEMNYTIKNGKIIKVVFSA